MGRPSKFDTDRAKRIVELVEGGNFLSAAAKASGIGISTLKRWMDRGRSDSPDEAEYRAFRAAVKTARARAETTAVARIRKAADDGTWQAAAWWLERTDPRRWGRVDRVKAETILTTRTDDNDAGRAQLQASLRNPEARACLARLAEIQAGLRAEAGEDRPPA